MLLDSARLEQAIASRDARFDGWFFVAVATTGIYCRPSCPARPRPENRRCFPTAAAAQAAGFRACKRCRPDATPGSPEWDRRADVVGRAMRLIADGVVDREGVTGLASRLGYTERHVHRQLAAVVGAGPLALARAQRAQTARVLLETTALPITDVAFAAGFNSVRQFNATVREIFALSPTALRARARRGGRDEGSGAVELRLPYRAPFDGRGLLAFLGLRAVPGVEEVVGGVYRRSLALPHGAGVVELRLGEGLGRPSGGAPGVERGYGGGGSSDGGGRDEPSSGGAPGVGRGGGGGRSSEDGGRDEPSPDGIDGARERRGGGHVVARFRLDDLRDLATAVQRSRVLLDLDSDPRAIVEALGDDALIGSLVRAVPGRRVPGHVDAHELAVRAVLGQQVSLAGAATLAARLVTAHGEPLERPLGTVTHAFPTAAALADADPERLAMPNARRQALLGLTGALARGDLVLDAGADRDEAREALLALPGIGPWTAGYVGMRALRDPDAFLPTDLGVRHALKRLGHDGSPRAAERLAERWRPYRAYALQHLWASLTEPGGMAAAA